MSGYYLVFCLAEHSNSIISHNQINENASGWEKINMTTQAYFLNHYALAAKREHITLTFSAKKAWRNPTILVGITIEKNSEGTDNIQDWSSAAH